MGNLVFQAALGGQVNLVGPNTASTFNLNVPAVAGTLVTTGDTGTVTSTMLASSVYTTPGTIGSGTPNTGAFTTLSATTSVTSPIVGSGSGSNLSLQSNATTQATLDTSGNLGLGVTPSAWSLLTGLDINSFGAVYGYTNQVGMTSNAYYNSGFKYKGTGLASLYSQTAGTHAWSTAASGTAGNAISFTQAMTLDASGRLGIGETSPAAPLDIKTANGAARFNSSDANGVYAAFSVSGTAKGYIGSSYQIVTSGSSNDFAVQAVNNFVFATGGSTERARIDSSGNFYFNSGYGSAGIAYGCRAWVNFNGTGTVAIRASGNVSSITDNGVGNYTVNFTTSMPDANYSTAGDCIRGASDNNAAITFPLSGTYSTAAVQIRTNLLNGPTSYIDPTSVFVEVFR